MIEIETPANGLQSDQPEEERAQVTKPSWHPGPEQVPGWGYVHSGGYPQYYRGSGNGNEMSECRWTVRASRKRRVRLTILDLSVRSELKRSIIHPVTQSMRLKRYCRGPFSSSTVKALFRESTGVLLGPSTRTAL